MTPLDIHNRQIATLRWWYQGRLIPGYAWVACRKCGALYPDPADLNDCHRCPLENPK